VELGSASSAREDLQRLRRSAERIELSNCAALSVLPGAGFGIISLFVALATSVVDNPVFGGWALFGAFLLGTAAGSIWAYRGIRSGFITHYTNAAGILRTTTLPQLILDEGFQQLVVDNINRGLLVKLPVPRTIVEQVRFAGNYWIWLIAAMGASGDRIETPSQWSQIKRFLVHDQRTELLFGTFRIRAICDFFLDNKSSAP
jgi:hypothetical protein